MIHKFQEKQQKHKIMNHENFFITLLVKLMNMLSLEFVKALRQQKHLANVLSMNQKVTKIKFGQMIMKDDGRKCLKMQKLLFMK